MGWGYKVKSWLPNLLYLAVIIGTIIQGMGWGNV